ncbi:hypothetical protein WA1_18795 [Scytonema hofmannii PCC 7110]|uniref:Uncharacterized protein n=1 Tax=Scytonema hofmannii PCC 7110 TaxID=128403 RepID=A0A139XBI5_9CYAN|nr:hypothetical protein [Scytonema hofmannii]KYC42051.1 hypothetical protein WA1_18795 [Scytonema hofmannii PCC 7110]
MKYSFLAILREGIPYHKSLREYTGSVTSVILMQQLDYWFHKYPDGFFKFLAPSPNHPDYREEDSWIEELGFSEKEFRTAFDFIGVRYASKSEFLKADNKFIDSSGEERFYCSYHDKQKGLTWYFRNHQKVDEIIEKVIAAKPPKERKKASVTDHKASTVTAQGEVTVNSQRAVTELPFGQFCNCPRGSSTIYTENTTETTSEREEAPALEIKTITVEPELSQPEARSCDKVNSDNPTESLITVCPAQPQNSGADKISAAPSAVAKFDQRFMAAYVPDEKLGIYLQVWNQERPSACGEAFKMDSKLRAHLLELSKSYTAQEFAEAVIYIREATEEFYRKEKFTLFRFTSPLQSHVGDCFTKHHNAMKTDSAYRDRVLGNAPSMDLGRSCPDLVGVPMAQQKYEQAVTEYNKPKSWLEQRAEERMRKYQEESRRGQEQC